MTDPGHDLVDRLIAHYRPDEDVQTVLASFREDFRDIGHRLVDTVSASDARERAIHALHDACMRTIFAIVSAD